MERQNKLGCTWGVHIVIALACWTGVFNSLEPLQVTPLIVFSVAALLETALVLGIRFYMGRSWVWFLGYVCWFTLLLCSLIPWVMMALSPPSKDSVEQGMTMMFLPLFVCLTVIPAVGVFQWNALQVDK